jgi:hypothetical protein
MVQEEGAPERAVAIGRSAVDSAYAAWQEALGPVWTSVLRAEAGGRLGTASAIEAMRDSVAARPFELTATFDNERGPDFSYLFEEAPVIAGTPADSTRLKRYAVDLVDLFTDKDTSAVFDEVYPELRDADYTPVEARRLIAHDWLAFAWRPIRADDVGLRSWSGGRVWELYRKATGDPLLVAGETQQTGLLEIYVAEVDGELKVVR